MKNTEQDMKHRRQRGKGWLLPNWRGPKVELKADAKLTADWPEGAVERVVFQAVNFPHALGHLPLVQYFGDDGWPLSTPQDIKPRLDPRMCEEFHRHPWHVSTWRLRTWLFEASDYDAFQRRNMQATAIEALSSASDLGPPA